MKIFLLFIFATSVQCLASAAMTDKIKAEAEACANAVIKENYEILVTYTHPRILQLMGGKETMIKTVKQSLAQMKDDDISFHSVEIGDPDLEQTYENWMTSIVPQHLILSVPGGKLHKESSLLGISEDEGKTWVFIDLGGSITKANFREIFPEIADKIELPPKKKPVLERD